MIRPIHSARQVVRKVSKALSEGGVLLLFRRIFRFIWDRTKRHYHFLFYKPPVHKQFLDVLFVNGCTLPHPVRYRVDHQIEQLRFFGLSSDAIFDKHLEPRHLHLYRAFVFYRCESSEFVDDFIEQAKLKNKTCFFDIDDLIYDADYVSDIEYVKGLEEKSYHNYMDHVTQLGKMISLCDYGITTTGQLQTSLAKRLKEVFVNPNVASSELLDVSLQAQKNAVLNRENDTSIRIGYLSGSVTHNPDLELVEDALIAVAKRFPSVKIVLVGLVSPSKKLAALGAQLQLIEFVGWKKLPELLANLDINVAPIEDTVFNRAKSENKWSEAALVRVPTVASRVGRLADVIRNGDDGFLCDGAEEWIGALSKLVEDQTLRAQVAEAAYQRAINDYVTQKTGAGLAQFIESKLAPLFVFVVPTLTLSGGMRVILEHAKIIKKTGADVVIYVDSDDEVQDLEFDDETFSVIGTREINFDAKAHTMVATLWTTANRVVSQRKIANKVYLVQNYEVDFYESNNMGQKQAASSTYLHEGDIEYVTISKWCQSWLASIYGVTADFLPNGIDYQNFSSQRSQALCLDGEVHILVEGNCDDEYKNVDESMEIVRLLKNEYGARIKCHYLAYRAKPKASYLVDELHFQVPFDEVAKVYGMCHVLIKSSKVESFSYPPIEMMASGGLVIVGENQGNIEYVVDRENCMLYELGDLGQAVDSFRELMDSEELRSTLLEGGQETAKGRDWAGLNQQITRYWTSK